MKKLKKKSQSYSSNMVSSELSALEFKILSYLKKHKKIFLTYDELKTLIKPHFPDDYILLLFLLMMKLDVALDPKIKIKIALLKEIELARVSTVVDLGNSIEITMRRGNGKLITIYIEK